MSRLRSIVIFCRDPYAMAPFWALALGLTPVAEDAAKLADRTLDTGESVLLRGDGPDVWVTPVQRLDPAGNRLHLDVRCSAVELALLLDAGATVVSEEPDWTVLADPEDNQFCAVVAT
ncbi:MAG: VOC family protein [Actinomycetes bacterium]